MKKLLIAVVAVLAVVSGWATIQSKSEVNTDAQSSTPQAIAPSTSERLNDQQQSSAAVEASSKSGRLVEGQELVFEFSQSGQGWVDISFMRDTSGSQSPIQLLSQGMLDFHVYKTSMEYSVIGAITHTEQYRINGSAPNFKPSLDSPFLFRLKPNGEIFRVEFPESMGQEAQQAVHQLLVHFQFMLPKSSALSQWKTHELDEQGVYSAEYQRIDDRSVQKIRKAHTKPLVANGLSVQVNRRDSRFVAKLNPAYSWIEKISGQETTITLVDKQVISEVDSSLSIKFKQSSASYSFPDELDDFSQLIQSSSKPTLTRKVNPKLEAMLEGLSLEQGLELFLEMYAANDKDSLPYELMIAFLSKYPEYSDELVEKLNSDNSNLGQRVELFMWYALAQAGQPLNQKSLINAAANTNNLESTRIRALTAIHSIDTPIDEVVQGLLVIEGNKEAEIADMALLALGSLAQPDEYADAKVADSIKDELVSMLSAADSEDVPTLLQALHNSRHPDTVSTLEGYLSLDDVETRQSAYQAMINITTDEALKTAFLHLENEQDDQVIKAALEAAYHHRDDLAINARVRSLVNQALNDGAEGEESILLGVELLGSVKDEQPENVAFLLDAAGRSQNQDFLKQVFKFVKPR